MKQILIALRLFLFMTVLTGVLYPLLITLAAHLLTPRQANGDILEVAGAPVGSELIAQKFEAANYLWPRPSAVDYKPLPSGGSNWGTASQDLVKQVKDRQAWLMQKSDSSEIPPQDLLFASASGLDPHISVEAANYQLPRLAKSRHMELATLRSLVAQMTEPRQWGMLGEPRVNVLRFNLMLDSR